VMPGSESRGPDVHQIAREVEAVVAEVVKAADLGPGKLLVVGCSTSEVAGRRIGSSGSEDVAAALVGVLLAATREHGFALAVQCCEHLNRALVVEDDTRRALGFDAVCAVPVRRAGGAAAAVAYRAMTSAVLVEQVRADAGIDIGSTLIGMHLRPVAIPLRPAQHTIGAAAVTAATTRPKLIGGVRAVYVQPDSL
jgi:uncharacterized protein (TIGR01440 family)